MNYMAIDKTIKTKRLILRPWKKEDLEPLSRLNADPRTMEFLFTPLTREESSARLEIYKRHIEDYRWGLWAVSASGVSDFIGWIGLWPISFDSHLLRQLKLVGVCFLNFGGKDMQRKAQRLHFNMALTR